MGYIEKMVTGIMPRVKYMSLAEFCDVFCEDGVFSIEESEYILKIAKKMGCKCEKNDIGSIEVGKKADFAIFDVPNIEYLMYHFGINHVDRFYKEGKLLVKNKYIQYENNFKFTMSN